MNKKPNIWIFSIEPLDTRYTGQWHASLPSLLQTQAGDEFNVIQIDGIQKSTKVTDGAFLNFSDTNYWKSSQLLNFLDRHNAGDTTSNDRFLITDFWNTSILQLKYISDLMGLNWQLHGIAHAGSYDPQDFLGRLITDKRWPHNTEQALFHALDYLYFATNFHKDMFINTVLESQDFNQSKLVLSGQPHDLLIESLTPYGDVEKRNLILFPHRVAVEKQPLIFRDLAKSMPEYEFVVCQDTRLSKDEYHQLLGQSKIVFSANLQETLGIGQAEAVFANSIPLVPDRLSYREMYCDAFKYDSQWTVDYQSYLKNKHELILKIKHIMENFHTYSQDVQLQKTILVDEYFTARNMLNQLVAVH